ncbi:aminodeoxychorismate synthase component I [Candidatus Poribacteria bacterium]|nr:aminodeoxychorismate synthase component I [Candidatus Poribacteria bacterium]
MYTVDCVATTDTVAGPFDVFSTILERHSPARPFLLETVPTIGYADGWSFLGVDPFLTFEAWGSRIVESRFGQRGLLDRSIHVAHPLEALQRCLDQYRTLPLSHGSPFTAGAVGAWSYDLRLWTDTPAPEDPKSPEHPDIALAFYADVLAFDHRCRTASAFHCNVPDAPNRGWVNTALDACRTPRHAPEERVRTVRGRRFAEPALSSMTQESFCLAVKRVQEYITAGDVYQINLTQRLVARWEGSPLELYSRLRAANPSPYAACVDLGQSTVLSTSPERFLRFDPATRCLETRPIKGTRPRGTTPDEDAAHAAELLVSAKDAAELVMIVDLERNDIGRVCEYGSVHVPVLRTIEEYANVLHTVATIEGTAREGVGFADMLRATFPGGSITGAPKIRAMQIIDELEPVPRGYYTGAVGYVDFSGSFDLNIAIRTVVLHDGNAYMGAGSGIVADSDPVAEYEESMTKAQPLLAALADPPYAGSRTHRYGV